MAPGCSIKKEKQQGSTDSSRTHCVAVFDRDGNVSSHNVTAVAFLEEVAAVITRTVHVSVETSRVGLT